MWNDYVKKNAIHNINKQIKNFLHPKYEWSEKLRIFEKW